MGNFNRDDRPRGGFRGGFSRGGFSRGGGGSRFGGGDREMFTAVCSNCGKECRVPFRPTNGKPVYCSDCFEKMGGRSDSRKPERTEFKPSGLDSINAKLDKIINLLEPKVTAPVAPVLVIQKEKVEVPEPVAKEEMPVEEIKAPKVKKTVKKPAPAKKK
jgi:CxxC-x17-CxxC domain-containing protein